MSTASNLAEAVEQASNEYGAAWLKYANSLWEAPAFAGQALLAQGIPVVDISATAGTQAGAASTEPAADAVPYDVLLRSQQAAAVGLRELSRRPGFLESINMASVVEQLPVVHREEAWLSAVSIIHAGLDENARQALQRIASPTGLSDEGLGRVQALFPLAVIVEPLGEPAHSAPPVGGDAQGSVSTPAVASKPAFYAHLLRLVQERGISEEDRKALPEGTTQHQLALVLAQIADHPTKKWQHRRLPWRTTPVEDRFGSDGGIDARIRMTGGVPTEYQILTGSGHLDVEVVQSTDVAESGPSAVPGRRTTPGQSEQVPTFVPPPEWLVGEASTAQPGPSHDSRTQTRDGHLEAARPGTPTLRQGGLLPLPTGAVFPDHAGDFAGVLRSLDKRMLKDYLAEARRLSHSLGVRDPETRVTALVELGGFLSRRLGLPAVTAVRLVEEGRGSFDPETWSVNLPGNVTNPMELASGMLHEFVHMEQFFLMWRRWVPEAQGDPQRLASLVDAEGKGTTDAVAQEVLAAGGLEEGSLGLTAAGAWWEVQRGVGKEQTQETRRRAKEAYQSHQRAVAAAGADRLDTLSRGTPDSRITAEERAVKEQQTLREYQEAWKAYGASEWEKPAFAAQAAFEKLTAAQEASATPHEARPGTPASREVDHDAGSGSRQPVHGSGDVPEVVLDPVSPLPAEDDTWANATGWPSRLAKFLYAEGGLESLGLDAERSSAGTLQDPEPVAAATPPPAPPLASDTGDVTAAPAEAQVPAAPDESATPAPQPGQRRVRFDPAPPSTVDPPTAPPAPEGLGPETPRRVERPRSYARERADYHRRLAEAGGAAVGLHRVMEAFFRGFPELAEALPFVPLTEDLLPLVHAVLDDTVAEVTNQHLIHLSDVALAVAARGPISISAMRRYVEFDQLQQRLPADQVRQIMAEIRVPERAGGRERALEVAGLRNDLNLPGLSAGMLYRVLQLARQELSRQDALPVGPVTAGDLLPLVQRVLDPEAVTVTPEHVTRLVNGIGAIGLDYTLRPRHLARHFTRLAQGPDGPDGARDRDRELADLRELLADFNAENDTHRYEDTDLARLVEIRRSYHRDPRRRGYASPASYQPMVLELLGETPSQVTAQHIASLANLVRRARTPSEGPPRPEGRRLSQINRAALVRAAIERDWSTGERPIRGDGFDGNPELLSVPGLHYLMSLSNREELIRWLNGVVPGEDTWIDEHKLLLTLRTQLAKSLDEGAPFDVGEYRIELRPDVAEAPHHDKDANVPNAKLEQRVNRIARERQSSTGTRWTGYGEAGVAVKVGTDAVAALVGQATPLGGQLTVTPEQGTTAEAVGSYMYLKPDDKVGQLGVPVNWRLRLIHRKTGRWRDLSWTRDGESRQERLDLYVPLHLLEKVDPAPQDISGGGFSLHDMHHAVERVFVVDRLRKELRERIGDEEYVRWQRDIEHFLSSDHVAAVLADAHRRGGDRWQHVPRLMLRDDDGHFNLALTAEALSLDRVGKPTDKVKFDRLAYAGNRALLSEERRYAARRGAAAVLRFVGGLGHLGSRATWNYLGRGSLWIRSQLNFGQRAMRAADASQVVKLSSRFQLHADWGAKPSVRQTAPFEPVEGWSYVRVRARELAQALSSDQPTAQQAQPTASAQRVWWTPKLDSEHGIGFGAVKSLEGIDQLYDGLARMLVDRGFLPPEAGGDANTTPWQKLQSLPITGADLNKPGRTYRNWRLLVDTVSDSVLIRRVDDLTGAVVPLTVTHPNGNQLTVELTAAVTGTGKYVDTDDMMPVNIFVGQAAVGTKRMRWKTTNAVPIEGGIIGNVGGDHTFFGAPIGGLYGRTKESREFERSGETVSSNVMTYARTEGATSLFSVPMRFGWTVPGDPTYEVVGQALVWQPDSLTDTGNRRPPPDVVDTEAPSPLIGMILRGVVGATGIGALQDTMIEASPRQRARVREGVTPLGYKSNLPRALSSGWKVTIGDDPGVLRSTPVGRPQILKQITVYTEQMQESQAGRDQDLDTHVSRGWRAAFGFRTGLARDQGGGFFERAKGRGSTRMAGRTEGSYRDLTSTMEMYVVRTAVRNELRHGGGEMVTGDGELVGLLSKADVLARGPSAFDDPYHLVPAASPSTSGVAREAPLSLREGRFSTGAYPEQIGQGPLAKQVSAAANELGGEALQMKVDPLLSNVAIHLPEMNDGGKSWEVRSRGRRYELTLEAHAAGDPRYVDENPGGGLKLYTRSNDSTGDKRRHTRTHTGGGTGGPGIGPSDETSRTVTVTVARTQIDERSREAGFNMLTMDGGRVKGITGFRQPIKFHYSLRRVRRWYDPRGWFRPAPERTNTVVEDRAVFAPRAGSPLSGQPVHSWDGILRNELPDGVAILGVHGLGKIARAVRASGKRVRRGALKPSPTLLSKESLISGFRSMQSKRARFTGLTSGAGELKFRRGMTVHARLGSARQIYRIPDAEFEHYDHDTNLVGGSRGKLIRYAVNVIGTLRYTVLPFLKVGPRFAFGGDRTRTKDRAERGATEHRSWLRQMVDIYHIYASVTFTVRPSPDAEPQHHAGSIELIATRDAALSMGIPGHVLDSLLDPPPAPTTAPAPATATAPSQPGDPAPEADPASSGGPLDPQPDTALAPITEVVEDPLSLPESAPPGDAGAPQDDAVLQVTRTPAGHGSQLARALFAPRSGGGRTIGDWVGLGGTRLKTPKDREVVRLDANRLSAGVAKPRPAIPVTTTTGGGDVPVSKPVTAPTPKTTPKKKAAEPWQGYSNAEYRDRLREYVRTLDVPGDGNCFYWSILKMVPPNYLRQHVFDGKNLTGEAAIRKLRNWLADRLAADFAVANLGLPSRYGAHFRYRAGVDPQTQQAQWLADIRGWQLWDHEVGDAVAEVMARELGVPMLLVQRGYVRQLGPDSDVRMPIVRTPGHYQGAEWTTPQPDVPWNVLRPAPVSTVEAARNRMNARIAATWQVYTAAWDQLVGMLPALPPGLRSALRDRFDVDSFQYFDALNGYQDQPAPTRSAQQIDAMRRHSWNVRELAAVGGSLAILGELTLPNSPALQALDGVDTVITTDGITPDVAAAIADAADRLRETLGNATALIDGVPTADHLSSGQVGNVLNAGGMVTTAVSALNTVLTQAGAAPLPLPVDPATVSGTVADAQNRDFESQQVTEQDDTVERVGQPLPEPPPLPPSDGPSWSAADELETVPATDTTTAAWRQLRADWAAFAESYLDTTFDRGPAAGHTQPLRRAVDPNRQTQDHHPAGTGTTAGEAAGGADRSAETDVEADQHPAPQDPGA